jgi:hypothetical protein
MARSLNCALVKLGQQKEGALWTLVKDQLRFLNFGLEDLRLLLREL